LATSEAFAEVDPHAAKAIARSALKARHACGSETACIEDVLMQAMNGYWAAGATSPDAQSMSDLIADWNDANNTCRGSTDATEVAEGCLARDLAAIKLHDIGLCEGNYLLNDPNFAIATILREHWVPCVYKELQE
jgi:hypothetical protein